MNADTSDRLAEALGRPVVESLAIITRMIDEAGREGNQAAVAQLAVEAALLWVMAGDTDQAETAMAGAMTAARASGSEAVRLVVGWRYAAMLSMLDRIAEAARYVKGLDASLGAEYPLQVRLVGLSVSGTVAAASGRWREVLRLSEAMSALLAPLAEDSESDSRAYQSLFLQAHLGIAEASIRLGDKAVAVEHATTAFALARRHELPALGASALGVLFAANAIPDDVDIVSWLGAVFAEHQERGDLLGQIGSGLMLAVLCQERGDTDRALGLFADLERATAAADQRFAWAKVLILRARLRTDVDQAVHELAEGWTVLREIAGAMADPNARQSLLIDWRVLAADTLAWLHEHCPPALPPKAGLLAVNIMTALSGDGVAAALRSGHEDGSDPVEAATLDEAADLLAGRWNAEALAPTDLLASWAGRDVLAYRVLEARDELLQGWRVHVGPRGSVAVAPFSIEGAAAYEIKRLAVGDPRAPAPAPEAWRQVAAALLPPELAAGNAEELLLVPHGPLWLVPFGALEMSGSALVEQRTLSYLPSLSHPRSPAVQPPLTAAVLADPLLLGIETELEALAEVTATPPAMAATVAGLEAALVASPQVLLLGAHGEGRGPAFRLRLEGEDLLLDRLLGWRLPPWVIASSCLSGRHGAEVWPPGLVTVCLLQGAAHVLGAVWAVPSGPTAEIVAETIRYVGSGASPALALRRSQQAARAKGWPIRSWAGLITFG